MRISEIAIEKQVTITEDGYKVELTKEEARIIRIALGKLNFEEAEKEYQMYFDNVPNKLQDKIYKMYCDIYDITGR